MAAPHNEVFVEKSSHATLGKYILGYVASLVLTVLALWLVLSHGISKHPLVLAILFLAALQVIVQLFLFMHITEGDGPPLHSVAIVMGFFFTLVFVVASIWIMSFNSMVS